MADPSLPTHAELYTAFQTEVQDRAPHLTDWTEGSSLDALAGAGAALGDEVAQVVVDRFRDSFFDTAEGDALDALAADRYGADIARKPAAAAVGQVSFSRTDSSTSIILRRDDPIRGTVGGQTVTVTIENNEVFASGVTEIGPFNAEVSETGPQGNIASNVLDTVDGYPALTVTNTLFVGGALQETDEVFRARLRAYPNSLQRGTRAALRQGALSVPGVSFAAVDERFARPDQGGYVAVYIGDPDAQANAALVSAVEDELVNWQSSGIWVRVFAAAREEVALSLSVTVRRGSNAVAIEAAVRAAVLAYTNQLEPGETLYLSQVLAAAVRASGDVITARIPSPTADITPSVDQNAVRVLTSALSIALVEQDAD